eukprot:RCo029141
MSSPVFQGSCGEVKGPEEGSSPRWMGEVTLRLRGGAAVTSECGAARVGHSNLMLQWREAGGTAHTAVNALLNRKRKETQRFYNELCRHVQLMRHWKAQLEQVKQDVRSFLELEL